MYSAARDPREVVAAYFELCRVGRNEVIIEINEVIKHDIAVDVHLFVLFTVNQIL